MTTRAVVDVECLSLRTRAVILSVGVVIFDDEMMNSFDYLVSSGVNIYVDRLTQEARGRLVDPDTLAWWARQGDEAIEVLNRQGIHPKELTHKLNQFLAVRCLVDPRDIQWFCRGPHFDIAMIEDMCHDFCIETPWHYRKARDVRTYLDDRGMDDDVRVKRPEGMIPHNSLHDAAFDAWLMQRANAGEPLLLDPKDSRYVASGGVWMPKKGKANDDA